MSFQSDLIRVLKAEIGPSASLFYKKCMHQLKKDPLSITSSDLEEIADWAYEEIRSTINEETAFRVRHNIIQIPPNKTGLKRPFSSPSLPEQQEAPAFTETTTVPVQPMEPPATAFTKTIKVALQPTEAAALVDLFENKEDTEQVPDMENLLSKIILDLNEKKRMANVIAPATGTVQQPPMQLPVQPSPDPAWDIAGTSPAMGSTAAEGVTFPVANSRPEPHPHNSLKDLMDDAVPANTPPARAATAAEGVQFPVVDSRPKPQIPLDSHKDRMDHTVPAETPPARAATAAEGVQFPVADSRPKPQIPLDSHKDRMDHTVPAETPDVKPGTLIDLLDDRLARLETENADAELWTEIADLYTRSGKFREATQAYERAVELGVETPAIWNSLGDSYKKAGQYEDSDAAYARSLELNPDDPAVWLKRAKVLTSRNRYDDALVSCDKSLALDDSSVIVWHYKAFILKKAGRKEEALEIYTYIYNHNPKDENAARQITAIRKLLKK